MAAPVGAALETAPEAAEARLEVALATAPPEEVGEELEAADDEADEEDAAEEEVIMEELDAAEEDAADELAAVEAAVEAPDRGVVLRVMPTEAQLCWL